MPGLRLQPGSRLGRYEILRCIGHGGVGVVYEAIHRSLGRRVALKVLHAPMMEGPSAERAIARFLREGRAAAQVHHPHVVDVYDFGVEDGLPFLVMELVDGESLARLLRRVGKLRIDRALELLLPIFSAVAELHAIGIVHRDIKPANILIGTGGASPKLADFGLSRFDDGSVAITQSDAILGTLEYMAPEVVRAASNASEQSDQYALAITLYECTTGIKPFRGESQYELMRAIVGGGAAPPSTHVRDCPAPFDAAIRRAMALEPERRFTSVDELAAALLPIGSGPVVARWSAEFVATDPGESEAPGPLTSARSAEPTNVTGAWIAGGAAACALVGFAAWFALTQGEPRGTAISPPPPRAPVAAKSAPSPPPANPGAPGREPAAGADPDPVAERTAAPSPRAAAPSARPASSKATVVAAGASRSTVAAAAASPAASPSAAVLGTNGAPILDVP